MHWSERFLKRSWSLLTSSEVQSPDVLWMSKAIFYNFRVLREKRGVFGSLAAVSKITQSILTECQVVIRIAAKMGTLSFEHVGKPVSPVLINTIRKGNFVTLLKVILKN